MNLDRTNLDGSRSRAKSRSPRADGIEISGEVSMERKARASRRERRWRVRERRNGNRPRPTTLAYVRVGAGCVRRCCTSSVVVVLPTSLSTLHGHAWLLCKAKLTGAPLHNIKRTLVTSNSSQTNAKLGAINTKVASLHGRRIVKHRIH